MTKSAIPSMNINMYTTKETWRKRLVHALATGFVLVAAVFSPPLTAQTEPAAQQPQPAAAAQQGAELAAPTVQLYMTPAWQTPQDLEQKFFLFVGETRVLKLNSPVAKTAIGNGKVLSIAMVNNRDLLMIANDAGRSTLHLWLKDGSEVTYAIEVGLNSPEKTFAQVKDMLGQDTNIRASIVGNRVFLQAETLKPAQVQIIGALQKAFPDQIVLITAGDVALEERTVHINAQLVEIKRSALEKLGVEWDQQTSGPGFAVVGDKTRKLVIRSNDAHESVRDLGYVSPFRTALSLATVISSRINLLREQGDAYVVAEPRLTARCGGKADFTSGGELPIPVQNGLGSTNVEFKEYGVRLAIEPNCDKLGHIRAKVSTEVSQIDQAVAVMGVPGLLTRKAGSELDLIEGQSMLLSGLVSYTAGENENKVPFLGSIPLLGHLFKSKNENGERSELVVIITPSFITTDSETVKKGLELRKRLSGEIDEKLTDKGVKPLDWKPSPAPPAPPTSDHFGTDDAGGLFGHLSANDAAPAPHAAPEAHIASEARIASPAPVATASRHGYTLTGDASWRPLNVYDNGRHTVIEMPGGIPADRYPVLLIVQPGGEGGDAPVGYRREGSRYVVDGLFERAVLVAGAGYHRQTVVIARQP